jgi:hypothetical protein
MQKTFFEIYKQQQGEYMGTVLTGWLESMLPLVKNDAEMLEVGDKLFREQGLANAVKDNDSKFPADWRMSFKGRHGSNEPRPPVSRDAREVAALKAQVEALQEQVRALERKIGK